MPVSGKLYYSQHCEKDSANPPVVLIHGAGGTHLYWPPEIRRLPGYCVFAIDLPGHGNSEECDGQQTIGEYARYVLEWMQTIQLRRAVLVGHSMGSAIALALALHHPEYVVGLGLVSGGARLRVQPDLLNYASDVATFHRAADILISCSFSSKAPTRLVELASKRLLKTRQTVLYGDLQACNRFDFMDKLGSIQQPSLVVCGSADTMTPLRYAQFLSNSMPHAHLAVIPDAGHMVMLERPDLVAENLLSYLNELAFHPGEGF